MTVQELIQKLQKMPQQAEVTFTKGVGEGYTQDFRGISDTSVDVSRFDV